jgi:hypothetical protein
MSRSTAVLPLVALLFACAACWSAPSGSPPGETSSATSTLADRNQIRLTAAQSSRLVAWAETFRSCMVAKEVALGELEKNETQIRMALPGAVDVDALLAKTESCGERQGGPPHRSSLQYRPGEIVLYLPKQCLLDKKVAAS